MVAAGSARRIAGAASSAISAKRMAIRIDYLPFPDSLE
jgi:hypothetical protein